MPKDGLESDDVRALLMGTWIGIAILTQLLIKENLLNKNDVFDALGRAAEICPDQRRESMNGIMLFLERLSDD